MALGSVVNNALHGSQAIVVTVDQHVIQNQQGRTACLLQQIRIGQTGNQADLLACAKAQAINIVGQPLPAIALQPAWGQILVQLHPCLAQKQAQIVIDVLL